MPSKENNKDKTAFELLKDTIKADYEYRKKICEKLKTEKNQDERDALENNYVTSCYRSMYYAILEKRYNKKGATKEEKEVNEKELRESLKSGIAKNSATFIDIMDTNFGGKFDDSMRKYANKGIALKDKEIAEKRDSILQLIHENVDSTERRKHRRIASALGSEHFTPKYGFTEPGEFELLTGTSNASAKKYSTRYARYKERRDAYDLSSLTKNNNALLRELNPNELASMNGQLATLNAKKKKSSEISSFYKDNDIIEGVGATSSYFSEQDHSGVSSLTGKLLKKMKSGLGRMFNADSPVKKAAEAELYVKDPSKGDRLRIVVDNPAMNTLLSSFDGGFKYSQLGRNNNVSENARQLIQPLADYYEALGKYCKTIYELQKADDKGILESPMVRPLDKSFKAKKNILEKYKALKKSHEDAVSSGKAGELDSYLRAPLSDITGVGNNGIDKTAIAMAYLEGSMMGAKKDWGAKTTGYLGFLYESDEYAKQLEKTGKIKDLKEFTVFKNELSALKSKMTVKSVRNLFEEDKFSEEIEDFANKYRDSGFLHTFENQPGRLSVDSLAENRKNQYGLRDKTRTEQMDMFNSRMKTVDPRLMKSSPEFREFRRLFDQLQTMSKRIGDREMTDKESKEYIELAMKAREAATNYIDKKIKLNKEYKKNHGTDMKFKDSTQKRLAFAHQFRLGINEHLGMNLRGPEALEFNGTPAERALAKYKRLCELEASKRENETDRAKILRSFYRSMHLEKMYNKFLSDDSFGAMNFYDSLSVNNVISGANKMREYYHGETEKDADDKEKNLAFVKSEMKDHLHKMVKDLYYEDYVSTAEHFDEFIKYNPQNVEAEAQGDYQSGRNQVNEILDYSHNWVKLEMGQLVSYMYDNKDKIDCEKFNVENEMAGLGFHAVKGKNGTVIEHINIHDVNTVELETSLVNKYVTKEKHRYVSDIKTYTKVDPDKLSEYEKKYSLLLKDKADFMKKYEAFDQKPRKEDDPIVDEPALYAPGEFEKMRKTYEEELEKAYDGLDEIQKAKIKTGLAEFPTVDKLMEEDYRERKYYAEMSYRDMHYEQQFYANAIEGIKKGVYKKTPKPEPEKQEEKKPEKKPKDNKADDKKVDDKKVDDKKAGAGKGKPEVKEAGADNKNPEKKPEKNPEKKPEKNSEKKPENNSEKKPAKNPEDNKLGEKKPEIKKPEVKKPEVKIPEIKKPEAGKKGANVNKKNEPKKDPKKPVNEIKINKAQPKAAVIPAGASNQVIYASVNTNISDRYAAVMKSSNFKPGGDKNFDAKFNKIADMLVEQGKKQAANPKLMIPDKKLIMEMGDFIDDYNCRNRTDENMKKKAEMVTHAFEKLTFTGLRDDPAHDNFNVVIENDKSYRGWGHSYYEMLNQKNLSKELAAELDKSKNQETQKSKELKAKLIESAYKVMQYNLLDKEYTQNYNASKYNKTPMYSAGTNMINTLDSFEKKGTAKSFAKLFDSVPAFKKNFDERFISKATRTSRINTYTVVDCCLNAVADTIVQTGKANICDNIMKELNLNPKHVNDILAQQKIMDGRRKGLK